MTVFQGIRWFLCMSMRIIRYYSFEILSRAQVMRANKHPGAIAALAMSSVPPLLPSPMRTPLESVSHCT